MCRYYNPCVVNDTWDELTDDWETGVDHKWDVFRRWFGKESARQPKYVAKCTFCCEEHAVVVPL